MTTSLPFLHPLACSLFSPPVPRPGRGVALTLSSGVILALALTIVALTILIAQHRLHTLYSSLEEALHEARHDHVTGLPNHAAAMTYLRTEAVDMVGLLDLDGFRDINDRFGHSIGDQVLAAVADRLSGAMTGHGFAARLGGDEFLLIWTSPAQDAIQRAVAVLRDVMRPLTLAALTLTPSASLGLARPGEHLQEGSDLLAAADLAMDDAKTTAGTSLSLYADPYPPPPQDRRARRRRSPAPAPSDPPTIPATTISERTPPMNTTLPDAATPASASAREDDPASTAPPASGRDLRAWLVRLLPTAILTVLGALALIALTVIFAPLWLSCHDLRAWAASPDGLGLSGPWPVLVVLALNGTAILCCVLVAARTWRGLQPGPAGRLIWVFAAASAVASWRHASGGSAADASWFFPAMSLTGPAILHLILDPAHTLTPEAQNDALPEAIMRQIPVDTDTFGRWRAAWADLCDLETTGQTLTDEALSDLATTHRLTVRDLKKVRQAGPTGLLRSPIPPAVRLVRLAANLP